MAAILSSRRWVNLYAGWYNRNAAWLIAICYQGTSSTLIHVMTRRLPGAKAILKAMRIDFQLDTLQQSLGNIYHNSILSINQGAFCTSKNCHLQNLDHFIQALIPWLFAINITLFETQQVVFETEMSLMGNLCTFHGFIFNGYWVIEYTKWMKVQYELIDLKSS